MNNFDSMLPVWWVLIFVCIPILGYSQIEFEQGYFVDNSGNKIECLIRNTDWRYNPKGFKYKLAADGEVKGSDVNNVREFVIYNECKYISREVEMDRSSEELKDMSVKMAPSFDTEKLFLKVLMEGKASLYSFMDGALVRYFYETEDVPITQLVYKQYRKPEGVATNAYFRQQLFTTLKCNDISLNDVEGLAYETHALYKFFEKYNSCQGAQIIAYKTRSKAALFRFSLRPGIRQSDLFVTIKQPSTPSQTIKFGHQLGFRIGMEGECTLPFYKNKIAVVMEPVFQYYKKTLVLDGPGYSGPDIVHNFDYRSIELPISLRYYLFLNQQSRVFVNGIVFTDFNFNSKYTARRADGGTWTFPDLLLSSKISYGLGVGYDFGRKYSFECRYQFSRDLINDIPAWYTNYKGISLVVGWTFLKV